MDGVQRRTLGCSTRQHLLCGFETWSLIGLDSAGRLSWLASEPLTASSCMLSSYIPAIIL